MPGGPWLAADVEVLITVSSRVPSGPDVVKWIASLPLTKTYPGAAAVSTVVTD